MDQGTVERVINALAGSRTGTIASLVTATAATVAVVRGAIEIRRIRKERRERAAFETLHATQTPDYIRSIMLVFALPVGAGPEAIEGRPEQRAAVDAVCIIFEALGYAVFRRLVPLEVVDDLVGGAVRVSWSKLAPYADRCRSQSGSRKTWEWFQWLAEQLGRRRTLAEAEGAHVLHRDWRP